MTKTRYVAGQALQYSQGLLFGSERKNMTNMETTVLDSDHQALQHFLSNSQWDEEGVITEIQGRISELIGNPAHGSLHFDESGFLKDGAHSVGTKRQYCGRFGKVDNCQVGVFRSPGLVWTASTGSSPGFSSSSKVKRSYTYI